MKREFAVVTWHDAFTNVETNIPRDSDKIRTPYVRMSAGWLIRERNPIVLAITINTPHDGDEAEETLSQTLTLPDGCVKHMVIHEVVDE